MIIFVFNKDGFGIIVWIGLEKDIVNRNFFFFKN